MHPSDQIGVALYHKIVGVVAEPGRNAHSQSGPFVGGALCKALHLKHSVVEPYLALGKAGLAESGTGVNLVDDLPVAHKRGAHVVQISVAPAPEVQAFHLCTGLQGDGLPGRNLLGLAFPLFHKGSVALQKLHLIDGADALFRLVAHFRLGVDSSAALLDAHIGRIHIYTCSLKVGVERKGLIYRTCDVQPYVLGQSAVVGVEVFVAPLVFDSGGPLCKVPVVVHPYGNHILTLTDIRGKVETEGHDTVLVTSHLGPVHVQVHSLAGSFELDENFPSFSRRRQSEMLAVPYYRIRKIVDINFEGFVFIEGVGQGDFLPVLVVERTLLG